MGNLLNDSALELARKIRNHRLTPPELLEAYIDRIRSVDPDINALVVKRFEDARRKAHEQYQRLGGDRKLPPFYGVPISIKEMISVENEPITCGSAHRKQASSTDDADVVANVRNSGAIPIGLTNIPELGLWIESSNPVYGTTNNPHDPDRTAGGSSGGEAAIIAAGGSPLGIGSDMGGSIRIPASFCGIYGHKPSTSSVSAQGHFPHEYSPSRMDFMPETDLVSIGPMTRHATDLLPLFKILRSSSSAEEPIPSEAADLVDFSDVTAYLLPEPDISLTQSASDQAAESVRQAGRVLEERGASVESFPSDFFENATQLYLSYLESENLPPVSQLAGSGDDIGVTGELARKLFSSGRHTLPMLTLCMIDSLFSPSQTAIDKAIYKTQKLRDHLSGYLAPNNLLLLPTYPTPAPRHGRTLLRPFDLMYAAIFNILDFPVTAAPVSYTGKDLPLGIQIVAPMNQDETGIGTAMALEEHLGTPDYVS